MNLGKTLDDEVEHLRCELGELRQLLHESHEKESMAEGEAGTARNEVSSLRKELETWQGREARDPQVEQLREEMKRLELQRCWSGLSSRNLSKPKLNWKFIELLSPRDASGKKRGNY